MSEPIVRLVDGSSHWSATEIERQEQRALELDLDHYSIRAIADELGVSRSTAHRRLHAAIERERAESTLAMQDKRARRIGRAESVGDRARRLLDKGGDPAKLLGVMVKAETLAAKLEGTLAPIKVQHIEPDGEPDTDPMLATLLDDAERDRDERAEQRREGSRERSAARGFGAGLTEERQRPEPSTDGGSWWEQLTDEQWHELSPEDQHRAHDEWNARRAYGRELER